MPFSIEQVRWESADRMQACVVASFSGGVELNVFFRKTYGVWRLFFVFHGKSARPCALCGKTGEDVLLCKSFEGQERKLAATVLNHPNIRLKASARLKPRDF